MNIWLQLVASQGRLSNFLAHVQAHCDEACGPGTRVTVSGTPNGALGDQHAAYLHLDAHDILRLMRERVQGKGYDVYAMGNSLDPALHPLRELLDIPVLSSMQVACSLAQMIGDRMAVIATNPKFGMVYTRLIEGYGFGDKLVGVGALEFERPGDMDAGFVDQAIAERMIEGVRNSARPLLDRGAEVLIVPGPIGTLLVKHGINEIQGAPVIDLYRSLVKVSEAVGYLASACGTRTSRRGLYQSPTPESLVEAAKKYGL